MVSFLDLERKISSYIHHEQDLKLIKEILFWFFAIVFVYHIIRIYFYP